jgi:hypothetical protein
VANATEAADVSINHNIEWRIGEDEVCLGAFEQMIVRGYVSRVPAQQAMGAK